MQNAITLVTAAKVELNSEKNEWVLPAGWFQRGNNFLGTNGSADLTSAWYTFDGSDNFVTTLAAGVVIFLVFV